MMIESATFSIVSTALSKFVATELAEQLFARVFTAKKQHDELQINPDLPVEVLRRKCLQKICNLQQDVVLSVSDDEFLKRILPLTLDYVGSVYEASTKQELEIIDMSISRIENALTAYQQKKDRRNNIRLLAVGISLLSLTGTSVFLWYSKALGIDENTVITIIKLPVPVLLWSIIGSFAAILYRFTNAADSELNEPLRWLFSRPLTGIIMGAISYLIVRVGLISIQAEQSAVTLGSLEVMWLIAFLAGFSDRFSDYLLKNVVGKFSGSSDGDLITLETRSKTISTETGIFAPLNYINQKVREKISFHRNETNGHSSPTEPTPVSPAIEKEVTSVNETKIKIEPIKEKTVE